MRERPTPVPIILLTSATAIGNAFQIAYHAITAPSEPAILELPDRTHQPSSAKTDQSKTDQPKKAHPKRKPTATKKQVPIDPTYQWLVSGVFFIIVFCFLAVLFLAWLWPDPTRAQDHAVDLVDWGAMVSLGAFLGLLVGKLS